jgi:uncharacterized OsmC-like protein
MEATKRAKINGIDVQARNQIGDNVKQDHKQGLVKFRVASAWQGGTKTETRVRSYVLGDKEILKNFAIRIDEPTELLGENTAPNPQEMLMAALNACMMVAYVAGASVYGIALEKVEIESEGELDLRGFLGLDASVKPGYDEIRYTVRIRGNGTEEQFRDIHELVMKTSPNRWNIAQPVKLVSELVVE